MKLTKKDISELQRRYAGMQHRVKGLKQKAEAVTETLVTAAEIGVAAFGFGLMDGYFVNEDGSRGVQILGVPLDLGTAGALHILGFVGKGKWSEHWHSLANGALASYLTKTGAGMGDRMRLERAGRAPADAAASGVRQVDDGRHSGLGAGTFTGASAPLNVNELDALSRV